MNDSIKMFLQGGFCFLLGVDPTYICITVINDKRANDRVVRNFTTERGAEVRREERAYVFGETLTGWRDCGEDAIIRCWVALGAF